MSALHDLEAEESLLGGLLDDGDILAVADTVQSTDFYSDRNQHIYDALIRVFNANLRISPATVAAELLRSGHGEVSEATLEELRAQSITSFAAADVTAYASTVREHAVNRTLKAALERALRTVGDPTLTPEQKLDAAQHAVMDLWLSTRQPPTLPTARSSPKLPSSGGSAAVTRPAG